MRTPIAARIKTPFLSAGNWGGLGLHLRGNVTAFTDAASTLKWLEMHTDTHFASMYLSEAVALQQRFFDCFLKGEANGFRDEPRLLLTIRDPRGAYRRKAACWPLPETLWTRYHLDAASRSMSTTAPSVEASVAYDALQEEVTFFTTPFAADTEFTGPIAVKLFVSSSKARIAFTLDRHTKAMLSCRGCDSTPISESCARFADRNRERQLMKRRSVLISATTTVALAILACQAASSPQDPKYALKIPNGLGFSEFEGYETWQTISISHNGDLLAVILGNPTMIAAYKAGIPGNGQPFPDGAKMAKIHYNIAKNDSEPGQPLVPTTQHDVDLMVKDSKRFADGGGWGYGEFEYDAASKMFRPGTLKDSPPQGNDAKCGFACHTVVKAKDYVFTRYQTR